MKKTTNTPSQDKNSEAYINKAVSGYSMGTWNVTSDNQFPEIKRHGDLIAICPNEDVTLSSAKANANLICQAVNERQKLLDSNRELFEALKELHGYTASRVKKYDIKDSTYFHVINIMANGLHNKI